MNKSRVLLLGLLTLNCIVRIQASEESNFPKEEIQQSLALDDLESQSNLIKFHYL